MGSACLRHQGALPYWLTTMSIPLIQSIFPEHFSRALFQSIVPEHLSRAFFQSNLPEQFSGILCDRICVWYELRGSIKNGTSTDEHFEWINKICSTSTSKRLPNAFQTTSKQLPNNFQFAVQQLPKDKFILDLLAIRKSEAGIFSCNSVISDTRALS